MEQLTIQDRRSKSFRNKEHSYIQRKKPPAKVKRQNDIYITAKSNIKGQKKRCEDLLNSGVKEVYLHCLGSAILRGLNLTLSLVNNSNDTLTYAINTSTVYLIDEFHPLYEDDDISIQRRNNSAVHIKIIRNSGIDVNLSA